MIAYAMEWIELLVRWIHVITGVSWIGASFYFNWLNHHMRPPEEPREGVGGDLWAVHGGAFYQVTKYTVAPERLPKVLHWFKYEAYFTWISGFTLLLLVYHLGAGGLLIDPSVAELSQGAATAIGLGTLAVGWVIYDLMCKSPLGKSNLGLFFVGFGLVAGAAVGLCQVFSGRGAYIHVGALIGTIMAANVFFVIIPGQKKMVDAMIKGEEPDPAYGKAGAQRSLHNNYFTLPVLFIMVSNHYPMTFGHAYNWAVLIALSLISAGVRHWFNLRGQGHKNVWILPVAAGAMVALALVSAPKAADDGPPVSFAEAKLIINTRCSPCHSAQPTQPGFVSPPGGIVYDTPEQIQRMAGRIHAQAVSAKVMPPGNLTGITDAERAALGRWIRAGANIDEQ
ncbi:MAG: urate hydroxylase PuuD [Bradymonadia bacterium]